MKHVSVLLPETIKGLNITPNGTYVDGTYGGGGHTKAIAALAKQVIAIDRDKTVLQSPPLPNITFVHGNFSHIKNILDNLHISKIHGMVLDLGLSSFQIDTPRRGFSYMNPGRLDMRMDNSTGHNATDILNNYPPGDLVRIFKTYGEEAFARPIVKAIVKERSHTTITTTNRLVEIIQGVTPAKLGLGPVKRIFQAIRIEVNNELEIIDKTIYAATDMLVQGGRLCIITFHSLEDRIVKQTFLKLQNPCTCPRDFPMCMCNKKATVKIITKKPILPSDNEISENSRAKSAKLRILEKI